MDPANGFQFLGHRVSMRWDDRFGWSSSIEVPKTNTIDINDRLSNVKV